MCFKARVTAAPVSAVFSHHRPDLHRDHRIVPELTWNTFRNHLILGYEISKYDSEWECYRTQRAKRWFTAETFRGLMRLRGIESGGDSGAGRRRSTSANSASEAPRR